MSATSTSLKRATIGLVIVDVIVLAVVVGALRSASKAADRGEEAFVTLAKEVARASQAQVTAERMVAIGRGYMLTVEPELLARAQAAEAKLARTMQTLDAGTIEADDRARLDPVLASAAQYRGIFSALLSGEAIPREPREVAHALRKQLIPARDDLIGELDEHIASRFERLEAIRSSARGERAQDLNVVVVAGAVGVVASLMLLWVLIAGARALASTESDDPASHAEPGHGARLASVYHFPRRDGPPRPPAA
jgi:hypothetical protein